MAERKMLSLRELELMGIKRKILKEFQEPVFIKKEIISILKALGCKSIDNCLTFLKNGQKLGEIGLFSRNYNNNKFYFLTDVWKLLLTLDSQGRINLAATGLEKPTDLAGFEIPLDRQPAKPTVGFSYNTRGGEQNLQIEGFWENGVRALEE